MDIGKPVIKYRKASQAPKRFKSSYMFFSTVKHKEIRTELIANTKEVGQKIKTTDVAKLVSKAWKALPEDEREKWDEIARQDKARYEIEKLTYTGPWKVPIYAATTRQPAQQKKHKNNINNNNNNSNASSATLQLRPPIRPLSAFLSFSNSKRSYVKDKYKDATSTEISSILALMWKDADPNEKQVFLDMQFRLEQNYSQEMVEWEKLNRSIINDRNSSSAATTVTTSEPLSIITSSTAYCTDMAAHIFDDLSPYSSLSKSSSSGAGAGAGAGAGLSLPSTIYSNNGGYDQHNQGQQQHQQQQQNYSHYDYNAYNNRNPYGETTHTNGYQPPSSSASTVTNVNHNSYDRRYGWQQPSYDYNTPSTPPPLTYDHHQQQGKQYQQQQQQLQQQPSNNQNDASTTGNNNETYNYHFNDPNSSVSK